MKKYKIRICNTGKEKVSFDDIEDDGPIYFCHYCANFMKIKDTTLIEVIENLTKHNSQTIQSALKNIGCYGKLCNKCEFKNACNIFKSWKYLSKAN